MALDWTHQFCLACDRQVQVDDDAYCSEACRMADFEKTDSSPDDAFAFLSCSPRPSYDFAGMSKPASHFHRPASPSASGFSQRSSSLSSIRNHHHLTSSSSHSSLCSMQSTTSSSSSSSSTPEPAYLSDKAKMELRAYAVSFEQVRLQRRRSY